MKSKFVSVIMAAALMACGITGCGSSNTTTGKTTVAQAAAQTTAGATDMTTKGAAGKAASTAAKKADTKNLPVLRVAVMPFYLSSEVGYMIDNGLDVQNGFKIQTVMFSSGAPINEALSTDSFDIAPTGGAYLFGVAKFNAKLIGSHVNGTGGNEIWVKKNSDIAKVKGANSSYPDVLGDAASVKGKKILQTTGTTGQYVAVKWLNAIGADEKDTNMVNMDFAQVFNAFKSDQGQAAALVSPYCFQTDDTMVKAADLNQLGIKLYEEIIVPDRVYQDSSKTELICKFLKTLYSVGDKFESDPDTKFKAVYKWYQDNGSTATEDDVKAECKLKPFITTEEAKKLTIGEAEIPYAEFMVSQDKLDTSALETFKKNIDPDYLKKALQ